MHTKHTETQAQGQSSNSSRTSAPLLYVDPGTGQIHNYGILAEHIRERIGTPNNAADDFSGLEIFLTQDAETQSARELKRYIALVRDMREIFEMVGRPYASVQEGRADV